MTATAYDVFISHAFEDKNTFTNALALALKQKGLKVWYSGFELKMGDSITSSVNNALKNVKYAVVVISPIYLEKKWAMNELQALFAGEAEHKRILPILHQISIEEIKAHLPMLADRYAISSDRGLEVIVNKILEVVTGKTVKDHTENFTEHRKSNSENEQDGFITLGRGKEEKKESGQANNINKNINNNSNNVNVHTGGSSIGIIIFIIVIAIIAFFVLQNIDFGESPTEPPTINKSHSRPSNSE